MNIPAQNICIIANKANLDDASIGWVAIAILQKYLANTPINLQLIEVTNKVNSTSQLASMTPDFYAHMQALNISEIDLLKHCGANLNLGFLYQDAKQTGAWVSNVFGEYGVPIDRLDFFQLLQMVNQQQPPETLESYSLAAQLALKQKFRHPETAPSSIFSTLDYGWNLPLHHYFLLLKKKYLASKDKIEISQLTVSQLSPKISTLMEHSDLVLDFRSKPESAQIQYQTTVEANSKTQESAIKIYPTELGLISKRCTQKQVHFCIANKQKKMATPKFIQAFNSFVKAQLPSNNKVDIQIETSKTSSWHEKPIWRNNTLYFGSCDALTHYTSQLQLLHDCIHSLAQLWPSNMKANQLNSLRDYFNREVIEKKYQPVLGFEEAHILFGQPNNQLSILVTEKYKQLQLTGQIYNDNTQPYPVIPSKAWLNLFRALGVKTDEIDGRIKQVAQNQLKLLDQIQLQIKQNCGSQIHIAEYLQRYQAAQQ